MTKEKMKVYRAHLHQDCLPAGVTVAQAWTRSAFEKSTSSFVNQAKQTLADIDHEHHAKLERLRLSRMPMVWQEEIAETLRREHDMQRAAYVQRLRELDDEGSADDART